jgi:hypothetical protein
MQTNAGLNNKCINNNKCRITAKCINNSSKMMLRKIR